MREYEQQGHKFIELDVMDHPNITVLLDGFPIVAVRDNDSEVVVNTITMPRVTPKINNIQFFTSPLEES